jgi:hypothetical protein
MASVRRQVFAQARQPSAENREQQTANVGNRNELITAVYCSTQFEYQRRWCLTGCSRLAQVAAERGEEPVVGHRGGDLRRVRRAERGGGDLVRVRA